MTGEQLRCLIVGETPQTQLLGWRLSLGSTFIILVSQYVSSDGLVAWKSSRLGANFYTPNIFTKSVKDLSSKLPYTQGEACKFPIDIMIVSGISIDAFQESCEVLSTYATKDTTVLVSGDFGCELEHIALKAIGNHCRCVLSIACDVECRQLSLGSYALVNDDNCKIYFGLTYLLRNCEKDPLFLENEKMVYDELDDCEHSNIGRMVSQLKATSWIQVELFKDSQQMALKIWELVIPKISLNILSIIYEEFDYESMLDNKSTELIFKGLVMELFRICFVQCNSNVEEFVSKCDGDNASDEVDFNKVIEYSKRKKMDLINTTANEYPEYLFLPFEPYCFYHRFEYPAQILLYQPIILAVKYKVSCSNLNFLYGFYSRLLSLSGLSIDGGRLDQHKSQFDQNAQGASASPIKSGIKTFRMKRRVKNKKNKPKAKLEPTLTTLSSRGGQGMFSVASPTGTDFKLPIGRNKATLDRQNEVGLSSAPETNSDPGSSQTNDKERQNLVTSSSEEEPSESEEDGQEDFYRGSCDYLTSSGGSNFFTGLRCAYGADGRSESRDHLVGPSRTNSRSAIDPNVVGIPHFTKKYSSKPFSISSLSLISGADPSRNFKLNESSRRPYTTSSLELQIRTNHQLMSKEYQDLYRQSLDANIATIDKTEYEEKRRRFASMEKQMWHFQRRYNITNGIISRPNGAYNDLLKHIEILSGEHNNDVIRLTTSRYGDLDLYTSILKDKDHIVSLLDKTPSSKKGLDKDTVESRQITYPR